VACVGSALVPHGEGEATNTYSDNMRAMASQLNRRRRALPALAPALRRARHQMLAATASRPSTSWLAFGRRLNELAGRIKGLRP